MKNRIVAFLRYFIQPVLVIMIILIPGCRSASDNKTELRGIWLHQSLFSNDKEKAKIQIDSLFNIYKETGINNLFCYNTLKEENNLQWDYLQLLIDEGHERGLKIHPVFCPGHNVDPEKMVKEHPGWLIKDIKGNYCPSLNLANPEVRQYWLGRISEALKYDIDGIHLDYIRFPLNQTFSYDSITCATFRKEYGVTPLGVPHDGGSIIWCEWIRWNEKQVTAMVREVYTLIKKSGKKVLLGADVFPDPREAKTEVAQNWGEWANEGIIDFVCPMLYVNDTRLFSGYLDQAMTLAGKKCKVYAGIGLSTSHNKITKGILINEVQIARNKKASGLVFFSDYSFSEEIREVLMKTLFKPWTKKH